MVGFDQSAALLAALESDQVFFLKPYFAALNGTEPLANTPIGTCFDESMNMPRYVSDITRQLYDNGSVSARGTLRAEPLPSTLELVSYSEVDLAKRPISPQRSRSSY